MQPLIIIVLHFVFLRFHRRVVKYDSSTVRKYARIASIETCVPFTVNRIVRYVQVNHDLCYAFEKKKTKTNAFYVTF